MQHKSQSETSKLHPRNKNRERYDLTALLKVVPSLKDYIMLNKAGAQSVDFSNPKAVKLLNKGLLHHYYGISYWEFPDQNLCPPIPGRADYIHYLADLLSEFNLGEIPTKNIIGLDIGTGASCIYPLLGVTEYNWQFIASDIDKKSVQSAQNIINSNANLKGKVTCKFQNNSKFFFRGILTKTDKIDVTLCNPPFHSSVEDALKGTRRKIKNLTGKVKQAPKLNFSGNTNELVYKGGELQFIRAMIIESKAFAKQCFWFTSLVSKESNLKPIYKALKSTNPTQVKTIPMGTGNKISRIVAWTYWTDAEIKQWQLSKQV